MTLTPLHNTPLLFALERNPQPGNRAFPPLRSTVEKRTFPQVGPYEQVTTENFPLDFFLTCEPLGNTIQLQGFDGCDSVEADSPIEHHPGRTGERMLTLRGEHFYFTENIGVIFQNERFCPRSPVSRASELLPDALAGWISRGNGILAEVRSRHCPQ
jgi:hypothetical protein